ncbi:ABC-ATPase domain-containing protein [bacterium]|nr:ABC-ATPase domain-containing protein [bacterium]
MKNKRDLRKLIQTINERETDAYAELTGEYDFSDFVLTVDYVAHDVSRVSARMRVRVLFEAAKFPHDVFTPKSREIGARDFLVRSFDMRSGRYTVRASGVKGGRIFIDRPGQEMLESTAVVLGKTYIEVRFTAELPVRKGKVDSSSAAELLMESIPRVVLESLIFKNVDGDRLAEWIEAYEDADAVRAQLSSHNLVAFIADGSILPRKGADDPRPAEEKAHEFTAPDELAVTLDLPNRGHVRGLGIPAGITLLTGGRFHGKSTVLRALELGVYNHIPGDGRTYVITVSDAAGIHAETGRRIERVNLTPFFGSGGSGIDTANFSSENATATESIAANIMETLEIGSSLLLFDEDSLPADMIVRDARMQALIPKDDEPSATLIDILPVLRDEMNVSAIIALSGAGDYFDIADTVIAMKRYSPVAVTAKARKIAADKPSGRKKERPGDIGKCLTGRLPLEHSFEPDKTARSDAPKPSEKMCVQYGSDFIDISRVRQVVNPSQARAISRSLALVHRLIGSSGSLGDVVKKVINRIETVGLDTLSSRMMGDLAMFRAHELAAALNRMRKLKIK